MGQIHDAVADPRNPALWRWPIRRRIIHLASRRFSHSSRHQSDGIRSPAQRWNPATRTGSGRGLRAL